MYHVYARNITINRYPFNHNDTPNNHLHKETMNIPSTITMLQLTKANNHQAHHSLAEL